MRRQHDPWQPIETAPKDGTQVLVWFWTKDGAPGRACARWIGQSWRAGVTDRGTEVRMEMYPPQGWMPLPDPPKDTA